MKDPIRVTMLGNFSIRGGDAFLDEHTNRMKKVWLLLAYLIYSRNARTTQDHFLSVVQGADNTEVEDPAGRLKALFYRARAMLSDLYPGAGHDLIQRKNGTYGWNTEIPLVLDVEEFDRLCSAAELAEEEEQLQLYQQALALYGGDFLPKQSMEPWAMPIAAYYHQMYLNAVGRVLSILSRRQAWTESAALCAKALKIEPYSEELYQHLMRCRLGLGDRTGVQNAYQEMSELLFDTFGVMPSDESRELYRQASRQTNDQTVAIGTVEQQLQETEGANGAVYCEYDFFRFHYRVQARSIERTGEEYHMALLSLHGADGQKLSRRSLDRAMDNLQEILLSSLRKGDVVSRCSISQFVVMLPRANYENSKTVCTRLIKAFNRQYPHSPATIHAGVQPLVPKKDSEKPVV